MSWIDGRRSEYHVLVEQQRAEQARTADASRFVDLAGSLIELSEQIAGSFTTVPREVFAERARQVAHVADELIALSERMA
jgi:hypothetical protein